MSVAVERRALNVSIAGAVFMTVMGIGFALPTGSDAILLDGFFSGLSVVIAIFTRRVADLQEKGRSERFQFGYAPLVPFLNTIRSVVIVILAGFAVTASIRVIFAGGRELEAGWAVIYGVTATVGCAAIAIWMRRQAEATRSPLVAVDAKGWIIDAALSAVVSLAFIVAMLLEGTSREWMVPYIDPVLVVLITLIVLPIPLGILRQSVGELLLGAPAKELQEQVRRRWDEIMADEPIRKTVFSMTRVGRTVWVFAQVVVDPEVAAPIAELDRRRERIQDALREIDPDLFVDVLFTADEKWTS